MEWLYEPAPTLAKLLVAAFCVTAAFALGCTWAFLSGKWSAKR
jgi:hypothetical protein